MLEQMLRVAYDQRDKVNINLTKRQQNGIDNQKWTVKIASESVGCCKNQVKNTVNLDIKNYGK